LLVIICNCTSDARTHERQMSEVICDNTLRFITP